MSLVYYDKKQLLLLGLTIFSKQYLNIYRDFWINQDPKSCREILDLLLSIAIKNELQQLLIKPTKTRVAGQSPATGFILLFVVSLKANCCMKKSSKE